MKKILTIVLATIIGVSAASAQYYKQSIGIRLGYDIAANYKYNFNAKNFIDVTAAVVPWGGYVSIYGIVSFNWNWNFDAVPGLSAYVGPGIGLGCWYLDYFEASINCNGGVEYSFLPRFNVPIALSLDVTPGYGFIVGYESTGAYVGSSGITVKYTF